MRMELSSRVDYGAIVPWVRHAQQGIWASAGPDALYLRTDVETHGENFHTVAEFTVSEAGLERVPDPAGASPPGSCRVVPSGRRSAVPPAAVTRCRRTRTPSRCHAAAPSWRERSCHGSSCSPSHVTSLQTYPCFSTWLKSALRPHPAHRSLGFRHRTPKRIRRMRRRHFLQDTGECYPPMPVFIWIVFLIFHMFDTYL